MQTYLLYFPTKKLRPGARELLLDLLRSFSPTEKASITVCTNAEESLDLPTEVSVVRVPCRNAERDGLPVGAMGVLERLASEEPVLLLGYAAGSHGAAFVRQMGQAYTNDGRVHIGVAENDDHPCQYNRYANVAGSRLYLMPDRETAPDDFTAIRHLAQNGCSPVLSRPFSFPWGKKLVFGCESEGIFRFEPAINAYQRIDDNLPEQALLLQSRLLLRVSDTEARQIAFGDAAHPLPFLGVSGRRRDHACLRGDALFVHAGEHLVHLLPLDKRLPNFGCDQWAQGGNPNEGAASHVRFRNPHLPFLLTWYQVSEAPGTDVELPYVPSVPLWQTSSLSFGRYVDGKKIIGRQQFPTVYFNPRLVAIVPPHAHSHSARSFDENAHHPVVLNFPSELQLAGKNSCRDESAGKSYPGAQRNGQDKAGRNALESPYVDVSAAFGIYRETIDFVSAARFDTRNAAFKGLRIATSRAEGQKQGSSPATNAGEGRDWAFDLIDRASRINDENDLESTRETLGQLHAVQPEFAKVGMRIGFEKYFKTGRFDHFVALVRDAEQRGAAVPLDYMLPYAKALATINEMEKACEVVSSLYAMNPALKDGYAHIAAAGIYGNRLETEPCREYLRRDQALGRAGSVGLGLMTLIHVHRGELDQALDLVRYAYTKKQAGAIGGYGRVGWESCITLDRQPEKVFSFFEKDWDQGTRPLPHLNMAAWAFCKGIEQPEKFADSFVGHGLEIPGIYSMIGIMDWSRRRDADTCKRLFLRDYDRGAMPFVLLYLFSLHLNAHCREDVALNALVKNRMGDIPGYIHQCACSFLARHGYDEAGIRAFFSNDSKYDNLSRSCS